MVSHKKIKEVVMTSFICGERGIRTPGASQHGGFQDRCNRPLYHLSERYDNGSWSKSECKGSNKS